MFDDPYYNYSPTIMLKKPVALVGFIGARVPLTGAILSTLTGLPYIDLDRHVEHAAGRSLRRLVTERGVEEFHAHERRVLQRVLKESPPPIVALGFSTLSDRKTRDLVYSRAQLFYVQRPLDEMHRNLLETVEQATGRYWTFARRPPEEAEMLRGLFETHRVEYERVPVHIQGNGRHASVIAAEVLRRLEAMN